MGERKVLNKYIPADFDPRLVPRGKKPKDDLVPVRMMLPFSVQCSSCSSFMYRGTKFNSKKEPVRGPNGTYLGIQRYRLYIKCTTCAAPISFLTDPKNADYEMEMGGTRNYEVWHDKNRTEEEILAEKENDEKLDPMKALENRVLDSQREMQDLENLDEIKAMNMRHLQMVGTSGIDIHREALNMSRGGGNDKGADGMQLKMPNYVEEELNEHGITASEEEMIQKIEFGRKQRKTMDSIKRIKEKDEHDLEMARQKQEALLEQQQKAIIHQSQNQNSRNSSSTSMPIIKVRKKRKLSSSNARESQNVKATATERKPPVSKTAISKVETKPESKTTPLSDSDSKDEDSGLGGLLGAYGSSSDSD